MWLRDLYQRRDVATMPHSLWLLSWLVCWQQASAFLSVERQRRDRERESARTNRDEEKKKKNEIIVEREMRSFFSHTFFNGSYLWTVWKLDFMCMTAWHVCVLCHVFRNAHGIFNENSSIGFSSFYFLCRCFSFVLVLSFASCGCFVVSFC